MAAGNCPETPRQKMIGMMYLFYTALLALNVSSEVINAFVKIDDSIKSTTQISIAKTAAIYDDINVKSKGQPDKFRALVHQSDQIKSNSDRVFNDIDRLKLMIIKEGEGPDATLTTDIKKKDNLDAANIIMIGDQGPKMGDSLRMWIDDYKKNIISIVPDSAKNDVYGILEANLPILDQLDDPQEPKTWQMTFSKGMPLIGTIALLSKLQADVKNAEASVLDWLIKDLAGLDIRISSLEGLVSSSISFIVRGETYNANIFLGARDTTMRPVIHLTTSYPFYDSVILDNGKPDYKLRDDIRYEILPIDETGKGIYTVTTGAVGSFTYGGLIEYKSNKGNMLLPYQSSYQVGDVGFTISATKCNVFYRGLENPTEVAVSGYPREDMSVSISPGAQITQQPGGTFIVTIPQSYTAQEAVVTVSVKGQVQGSKSFRVLNVPGPTVYVSGAYTDGKTIDKATLLNSPYVSARLDSGFFPFEGVQYNISRFSLMYNVRGVVFKEDASGATFTAKMIEEINKMSTGSQVTFSDILCSGPSGVRQTNGVTLILR